MEVQRLKYITRGAVHCDGPCGSVIDGQTVEIRLSFNGQFPASAYYCANCAPSVAGEGEHAGEKPPRGCRAPTYVAGTNGGKFPCGSVVRDLNGERRTRLCTRCAKNDSEWLYGVPAPVESN